MAYLALQCPMGFPHISMPCQSVQGNTILTQLVNVCHPVVGCDFCQPILCISDLTSWSARIVHILILIYFLKEYKGLSESLHFPDVTHRFACPENLLSWVHSQANLPCFIACALRRTKLHVSVIFRTKSEYRRPRRHHTFNTTRIRHI